jgi:hypothetical protein
METMTLVLLSLLAIAHSAPNPPTWPASVYVFDPADTANTQNIVNRVYQENGGHDPPFNGQWSNTRYAFLFKPGTHGVQVNVGYYTTVIGLGNTPTDTTITNVRCENGDYDYTGGALDNFWRSAENFANGGNMLWAVSQASPLRRVYVKGNLDLYQYNSGCCAGYASGGWLSDSIVTGTITSGSQQQRITRNSQIGQWNGGVWNMVFVGNNGSVPGSHCSHTGGGPYSTVTQTPIIAEKPYMTIDSTGKYTLRVPNWETNKQGPTSDYSRTTNIDFANVYVTQPTDSAATINAQLANGLHVIFSPAIYTLTDSIQITRANTVVMGIGMATLISPNGKPAVVVGNVDGVRLGGILFQAGIGSTPAVIQWGETGYAGSASNPGLLFDVFARVGGTNNPATDSVSATSIVVINSGNVVIDNSWLWRADHGVSGNVVNSQNPNQHGLVVNGANVTAYGLASEHQLNDLVQWNGENGRTYFYQSELPYDVTEANFGTPGYVSYRVASGVQNHHVWGAGVYSYFRDNAVTTANGIVTGSSANVVFVNSLTVFLNGLGQITHIINDKGATVNTPGETQYEC